MQLHNLKYTKGSRGHKTKTLGRGYGSGMGKRSTRGQKGQHARKSGNVRQGFEGGQTPLYRKIPKVGFNNTSYKTNYWVFTTDQLSSLKVDEINPKILLSKKMIKKSQKAKIKIIAGKKPLKESLTVSAHKFSESAKKLIIDNGGKVTILNK